MVRFATSSAATAARTVWSISTRTRWLAGSRAAFVAWLCGLVLAYSRRMLVHVCFDQKIEPWLRLHVEAFAELGGARDRAR